MSVVRGLQVPSPVVVFTAVHPVAPVQVDVLFALPIWTLMFGGVLLKPPKGLSSLTVVEATVIPT